MQGFKDVNFKYCDRSRASHTLFIKPHSVREKVPEKPGGRTLFVVGVPPYCNEETLKALFCPFGNVTAVYLHKSPSAQIPPKESSRFFPSHPPVNGFKVAYVVFEKEKGLKKVLNNETTLILPKEHLVTGVKKWCKEYNEEVPNVKEMEEEIKTFMQNYDEKVSKKDKQDKDAIEADEDGWVTVTKKGRKPGFARKESVKNQLMKKGERQRHRKELTNFYRFQIRESKVKNLVALRQKFEEDKKKIAALKETRKFKPF